MSECPSASAERHFAEEEAAHEAACNGTALENGFTLEQADECDDGEMHCVDCPFCSPFEKGNPEHHWAVFTRRPNAPKLHWLMLPLREGGIPHRIHGLSFPAPVLWIRKADEEQAWTILNPIDDVPDDDPMFEGGK